MILMYIYNVMTDLEDCLSASRKRKSDSDRMMCRPRTAKALAMCNTGLRFQIMFFKWCFKAVSFQWCFCCGGFELIQVGPL